MNKTILLGRLTKAPEIKFSQTNNIKVGKLISKEEIFPVFLRLDSELATNKK